MRTINANETGQLALGYQEEDARTTVVFDLSDVWAEFPDGIAVIHVVRPGESEPYPVTEMETDTENLCVRWLVQDYDLAIRGYGECQLTYTAGAVCKTKIWRTAIDRSLIVEDVDPPTWEDWKNQMLEAAAEAAAQARAAAASADEAAGYADDAAGYADDASASAAEALTHETEAGRQAGLAETSAQASAESAAAAAVSADHAEQAAANVGYMYVEIDEHGHLIYTRTEQVWTDFELSDGRLLMEVL